MEVQALLPAFMNEQEIAKQLLEGKSCETCINRLSPNWMGCKVHFEDVGNTCDDWEIDE